MQGKTTFLGLLLLTISFSSLLAAQGSNSTGTWRLVGTGDCPGHSLGDTSGPNPNASRCSASMNGYTAVCWSGNCNYKDIATASCTGGASPGRMYTCVAHSTAAPPPATYGWRSAGTGDCPGHSLGDTSGPNPNASRCNASMNGYTAVCWSGNCNYKDIATASCTGGASPGRMYTCVAVSR